MAEPGWYNDPSDETAARWHDGQGWTQHTVLRADWVGRGVPPAPTEPVVEHPVPQRTAPPRATRPSHQVAQRRRIAVVVAFACVAAIVGSALVLKGGGGGGGTAIAVDTTTERTIDLAPGATLTVEKGDFRGAGRIRIGKVASSVKAPDLAWFTAEGDPVQIDVEGDLAKPVTVRFLGTSPPSAGAVPAILRYDPKAGWYPIAVGDAGKAAVGERTFFSPTVFGWIKKGADAVSQKAREVLGDRSNPPTCSGPPAWVDFTPPSQDVVHSCATTNVEKGTGTARAEVQIRNNRGVALEVVVPKGVAYASVEGQPELLRAAVRVITGQDSVLLPPGVTMSVGFTRPDIGGVVPIPVSISPLALVYTMLEDLLGGQKDTLYGVIVSLRECTPGAIPTPLGDRASIDSIAAAAGQLLKCAKDLLGNEQSIETLAKAQLPNGSAADIDKLKGTLKVAGRWFAILDIGAKGIDLVADLKTMATVGDLNSMSPTIGFRGAKVSGRGITEAYIKSFTMPPEICGGLEFPDPGPHKLTDGEYHSDRNDPYDLSIVLNSIAIGDLDGDGAADGAFSYGCNNGVADHNTSVVVIRAAEPTKMIDVDLTKEVTYADVFDPRRESLTDVLKVVIKAKVLQVRMVWNFETDANCCATTGAIGSYAYQGGKFVRTGIDVRDDRARTRELVAALNAKDQKKLDLLLDPGSRHAYDYSMNAGETFTDGGCPVPTPISAERSCFMGHSGGEYPFEVQWTGAPEIFDGPGSRKAISFDGGD